MQRESTAFLSRGNRLDRKRDFERQTVRWWDAVGTRRGWRRPQVSDFRTELAVFSRRCYVLFFVGATASVFLPAGCASPLWSFSFRHENGGKRRSANSARLCRANGGRRLAPSRAPGAATSASPGARASPARLDRLAEGGHKPCLNTFGGGRYRSITRLAHAPHRSRN